MGRPRLHFEHLKLCERKEELKILNSALDRLVTTAEEHSGVPIVLLEGPAGSGKSFLVDTAFSQQENAVFVQGKFEQGQANVEPFAAIAQALDQLAAHLLRSNDRDEWKVRIEQAFELFEVPQIPSSLMPRLSDLMEKASSDAQGVVFEETNSDGNDGGDYARRDWGFERLKLSFRAFLHTVSSRIPIILFLDDLQWASENALEVIQDFVKSAKSPTRFMLVATRRPVDVPHIVLDFERQLKTETPGNSYRHIRIQDLSLEAVGELLNTLLRKEAAGVEALAEVVHRKTGGNAFFVVQFIRLLEEKNLVYYSTTTFGWEWKLDSIRQETDIFSDNVVDMIANKIRQAPEDLQSVLMTAACFGFSHFDARLVFNIMDELLDSDGQLQHHRHQLPTDDTGRHNILLPAVEEGILDHLVDLEYKFAHDRIRDGALSLLPEGVGRARYQLYIGQRLKAFLLEESATGGKKALPLSTLKVDGQSTILLLAVSQLNAGMNFISDPSERVELAEMNYQAARVAVKSSSFFPAADFLGKSVYLLGDSSWQTHYKLMMKVSTLRLRMEYCCGRLDKSVAVAHEVLKKAKSFRDKNMAYQSIVLCQIQEGKPDSAFHTLFAVLKELNAALPRKFLPYHIVRTMLRTKSKISNMTDDDILVLDRATDETVDYQMGFLERLLELCFFHNQDLIPLVILRMIGTTLEKGHNVLSARSLACYGWFLARMGNYDEANRFAKLAIKMVEDLENDHPDQRAVIICNHFVFHWRRSYQDALEPLLRVNKNFWDNGMIEYVLMDTIAYFYGYFCSGLQLAPLEKDSRKYFNLLREFKQGTHLDHNGQFFQAISNLIGKSECTTLLTGEFMDEAVCQKRWTAEKNASALHHMHFYSMMLGLFFSEFDMARKAADKLLPMSEEPGDERITLRFFFEGMIALIILQSAQSHRERKAARRKGRRMLRLFKGWVKDGAPNAYPMLKLLQAEKWASSKRVPFDDVLAGFDSAVTAAAKIGMLHIRALANERAGNFCLPRDHEWARTYLTRARDVYRDWGALAKVRQMEKQYAENLDISEIPNEANSSLRGQARLSIVLTDSRHKNLGKLQPSTGDA